MKLLSAISVFALLLTACGNNSANAQLVENTASAATVSAPANQLVVAELFTSQGCSSCPAAEALFSKLAQRDNVLTMEWHVDYWDQLVHHGSKWKDPYSNKAFTQRQRSYNRSLRGKNASYTPQAVVNGNFEGVGSRPSTVNDMLSGAPALSLAVQIANQKITVGPSADKADILFVRLLEHHDTDVKGGENKGRQLSGENIVLEAIVLGSTGPDSSEFILPKIGKGETCAVLVQTLDENIGPIMGAAKCS